MRIPKFLLVTAAVLSFSVSALADIPKEKIDALSDQDKSALKATVHIASIGKAAGLKKQWYSDELGENLSAYSLDDLKEMEAYLENDSDSDVEHLEITVCKKPFSSEMGACFSVYETVADAGRQLGYVTQNNNPELCFDDDYQNVSIVRIYVSYYGECTKEEARETLEHYTDELIYAITETYPLVNFDIVSINWEVPAISKDNLYAASYWCENEDGEITRGEGKGAVYN